jgi:hypothetical protein
MNLELFKIQTQSVKRKTQCQMENARLSTNTMNEACKSAVYFISRQHRSRTVMLAMNEWCLSSQLW